MAKKRRFECPACGSAKAKTTTQTHLYQYGHPGVTLAVDVPVRQCENCGYTWLDDEGEDIIAANTKAYEDKLREEGNL